MQIGLVEIFFLQYADDGETGKKTCCQSYLGCWHVAPVVGYPEQSGYSKDSYYIALNTPADIRPIAASCARQYSSPPSRVCFSGGKSFIIK